MIVTTNRLRDTLGRRQNTKPGAPGWNGTADATNGETGGAGRKGFMALAARAPIVLARQHGGPVWPGGLFKVGERGAELFTPTVPGTIIPRGGTTGGWTGGSVNITVNVAGSITSEGDLVETIRRAFLRTAGRNVTLGLA